MLCVLPSYHFIKHTARSCVDKETASSFVHILDQSSFFGRQFKKKNNNGNVTNEFVVQSLTQFLNVITFSYWHTFILNINYQHVIKLDEKRPIKTEFAAFVLHHCFHFLPV